jgi:DNA modification methylase
MTAADKQEILVPASVVEAVINQEKVNEPPHNFYKYPARFSPTFAREVIKAFTNRGDLVFDPFCGGGTTLVEAMSLGRRAAGMDISSLAVFLTRTKMTPISVHDLREISVWLDAIEGMEPRLVSLSETINAETLYYLRNLPDAARTFFLWILECLAILPKFRQQNFVRLILLGVGQWGLDCKTRVPLAAEFKAEFCKRLRNAPEDFFTYTSEAAAANQLPRCRLSSRRRVLNRSSESCAIEARIPKAWIPAKLVLTSPPYPGVHVLYHRWQIMGRKETPAPFWLANQRDGAGESHYVLGPRDEDQLQRYYARLKLVFSSVRSLVDQNSLIVQLVAFSEPDWQLPRYIATMQEAGFSEVKIECNPAVKIEGRLWRAIPGRKWYANKRGEIPPSKEVMLLHRLAR